MLLNKVKKTTLNNFKQNKTKKYLRNVVALNNNEKKRILPVQGMGTDGRVEK